jgi:hypothetical protein
LEAQNERTFRSDSVTHGVSFAEGDTDVDEPSPVLFLPMWEQETQLSGKDPPVLRYNVEYLMLKHIVVNDCLVAGTEFETT